MSSADRHRGDSPTAGLLQRLRERGVLRVAASYAVIAWLLLQIADVTLAPLGAPPWAMTALIIAAAAGFPLALALAWFLEVGADGVHVDTAPEGAIRPHARGLRHYADAIVIGLLLVTVAVLLVRQSDLGRPEAPENPAIAVLPFENLSGDPAQEYFSDGLAEEMLDRLGRVPGLRVIARSSSFYFKGKDVDARTIARRLEVTNVLEGSVRRDGQRLKLTARLIDGATGLQTWSGSFDRDVHDVFAVQAELAQAIVNAIIPAARGEIVEPVAAPTTDLDAYDLYLLARTQWVIRTDASLDKAAELAGRAVQLDPEFAKAQAMLSVTRSLQLAYNPDESAERKAEWQRTAEAAAHRALALDPGLSEAHEAYALLLRQMGRPGVEEAFKRALELNPNNATAWQGYAVWLHDDAERRDDSVRATARSLELDPRQPIVWANYLGSTIEPGGERYRAEFRRAMSLVGDMPFALDRITMPGAVGPGYPVEVMRTGLAKFRKDSGDNLPPWLNFFRAWSMVDLERADRALADRAEVRRGIDYEVVRRFLEVDAAGLRGDWQELERRLAGLIAKRGAAHPGVLSTVAFWRSVQGRYDEAAQALAVAPANWWESGGGTAPILGNMPEWGAQDPAALRVYRATGRGPDADRLAGELLGRLRAERRMVGNGCQWPTESWMRYAGVAAGEGLREEAVDALQGALRCGDLPFGFQPQLPWFRSLEGYAPYDRLLQERARRVERIRAELLRLEAEAAAARSGS